MTQNTQDPNLLPHKYGFRSGTEHLPPSGPLELQIDLIEEPLGPLTYELDGLSGGPLIRFIADQIFDIVTEAYNVGCHVVAIL